MFYCFQVDGPITGELISGGEGGGGGGLITGILRYVGFTGGNRFKLNFCDEESWILGCFINIDFLKICKLQKQYSALANTLILISKN